MPFAPDIPPTKEVEGPVVEKNLDTYHLVSLNISINPNDSSAITVKIVWSKGYMDDETFVAAESHSETLTGQDVIDKIGAVTTGGSIYNEVKYAAWQLLQDRGIVPAGTIS